MKRTIKGDVCWTIPAKKTPIAYSTVATKNLIVALAEDGGTISEVRKQIIYDTEAKQVLDAYISYGYGEIVAKTWFR